MRVIVTGGSGFVGRRLKKVINSFYGTLDNWEDSVDFSYSRQGQDVRYALNDDKLRGLGWSPRKEFDKEIEKIVSFYKKNFVW